jgi:cobalt-zinc-cadmium resistance protein CzcA
MFKPMALVFCFALIGAMILCFTYVPVMASIFIKPKLETKRNISKKLVDFLENRYEPTIKWALKRKLVIIVTGSTLIVSTVFLFSKMGGEFVPTLDEGDFVIQPVLKTGTSLSRTTEITTRIEKILLEFPEVMQVVSRIGAAEVPTDPMSMEESDVIIKLKPKGEWVSANSKDELADKFKEALSIIPGVDYEFTQPIEMRFNELITGVRADLAIKVFGEDLNVLFKKAKEIENIIKNIEGATDITVEKIVGLPQMSIKYNRLNIAKYGLNIEDLNNLITTGFAGMPATSIFEGEKQFDLVVRFDKDHHNSIEDIRTATIKTPNGSQIPLSEFADIEYSKGPAKISREKTKRRIVVGVNVRNRDLESVVEEVQDKIEKNIKLETGYNIEYGGQFENLRTAKARLSIAIPFALFLIFILLYFAFNSVKDALIIFSAIPMSAVGGVFLLYLRGMPFSISAGVGFIALFGIAVLNGIVLIEEFKLLKSNGIADVRDRIILGTKNRLRPVLLTASAAALGFLPMAISTSAGAEVQRPLATVVVGGLISATALTLIVLPVLYSIFDRKSKSISINNKKALLIIFLLIPAINFAQENKINKEQAIQIAIENNLDLNISQQKIKQIRESKGASFNVPKTEIYFSRDNNNIAPNDLPLNVWGINQSFEFPTVYFSKNKLLDGKIELAKSMYELNKIIITKNVLMSYYEIIYLNNMINKYKYLDSLYSAFSDAANLKYKTGESNYLQKLTAESKKKEIFLLLNEYREKLKSSYIKFNTLLRSDIDYEIEDEELIELELNTINIDNNLSLKLNDDISLISSEQTKLEKQKLLPDFNISFFNGVNSGVAPNSFSGLEVGIEVPLFFGSQKSKINSAKINEEIQITKREKIQLELQTKYHTLKNNLNNLQEKLNYYKNDGNTLSEETIFHASRAFESGEINFLQYIQLLENASQIEINYLNTIYDHNNTVIEINFLTY